MWSPQTIGSPYVAGNQPGHYWPGKRFVDWVGADIYSAYATPGVWSAFKRFYRKWRHKPFVVGEYSPWDNDYRGRFTRKLFKFALRHRRTRMLIYYRSVNPDTPFDIDNLPAGKEGAATHAQQAPLRPLRAWPAPPGTPPAPTPPAPTLDARRMAEAAPGLSERRRGARSPGRP